MLLCVCARYCNPHPPTPLLCCPAPVPQASFDPPGITVSIKKDRTIETMLQPGNAFAVSMVTEAQAKRIRKVRDDNTNTTRLTAQLVTAQH